MAPLDTQHFFLLHRELTDYPVTLIFSSHAGHVNLNGGTLPLGTVHLVAQDGQITFLPSSSIVSFASLVGDSIGGLMISAPPCIASVLKSESLLLTLKRINKIHNRATIHPA